MSVIKLAMLVIARRPPSVVFKTHLLIWIIPLVADENDYNCHKDYDISLLMIIS